MRKAFSFTEILFAVMILGIGFIMVAAMFPVAIQQTQATAQESIGASVGRTGVEYMQQIAATRVLLPNTHPLASGTNSRPVVIPANTPTSILLPTLDPIGLATAAYPVPGSPAFPGGFPVRIPGQVWSLDEPQARDPGQVILGGTTLPHSVALWRTAAHNLIVPGDPRNGMVIMYKRDLIAQLLPTGQVSYTPAPDAQIIVIPVQTRIKAAYDGTDVQHLQGGPATLEPILANIAANSSVQIQRQGINSVLVVRDNNSSVSQRVAEGCYVVIANDGRGIGMPWPGFPASASGTGGQYAGHIFQVGVQQPGNPFAWTLAPGNDLGPTDPAGTLPFSNPQVFIVGRAFVPFQGPQGLAQDVGVYTGFINVN